nr:MULTISPECIES: iron-containing alcohol dehydrogenase [Collinsella]
MANRFVLNTISYHGSGAIKEIPGELQRRGYKKIFVCSDPDLVKFGVTAKVTDELDAAGIAWSLYSEIKPNPLSRTSRTASRLSRPPRLTLS